MNNRRRAIERAERKLRLRYQQVPWGPSFMSQPVVLGFHQYMEAVAPLSFELLCSAFRMTSENFGRAPSGITARGDE